MPHVDKPAAGKTTKQVVALVLSFTAGYVDIVGYRRLYNLFTANMTGNTVHLARNISQRHWGDAALAGSVLLAFVIGSLAGRALIEVGARHRFRKIASLTLFMEAVLIAMVLTLPLLRNVKTAPRDLLLVLAAAMGLQTATLTRIGALTVHTTFVTGMINKFAQLLSHALFLTYDRLLGGRHYDEKQQTAFRQAMFLLSIWILYCSGALSGARADSALGLRSLAIPVALLASIVIVDQLRPLSLQEERDQT